MDLTREITIPESKTVWFCGCEYHYGTGRDYFTHEDGHKEVENLEQFRTEYICTIRKTYMIEKWLKVNPAK